MSLPASAPPRRRPWMVILPVAAVLLLGAAWSGAWFYASSRADREIEAWIAREATQGRIWACNERQLGGFPFRFELMCSEPSVTFSGGSEWRWTARRAHAVAQVWNPRHIIAEFEGPAQLVENTSGRRFDATWSLMQVSGIGDRGRLERLSIASNNYDLRSGGASLFAAHHFEIHARRHPGGSADTLDIAAGMQGATGYGAQATGTPAPVDGELQAAITGLSDFHSMPLEERLKLWQGAGGRAKLVLGKLSAGGGVMTTTGDIGLDAQGRPQGEATVSVAGAKGLFPALSASGLMPPVLASWAPMVMAAGLPTEIEGRKASAFPFVFRDGRASLGILPLGKIGSVY